jgi:hypothetical protein
MLHASDSDPASSGYRLLFVALVLTSLCCAPLAAQKTVETKTPAYDLHSEAKMKGTVDEVKEPAKGSEKEAIHLLIKIGADTTDLYLCPKSFLVDMGLSFAKGDEIALTGSKIKANGAELILVREVVKGNDTLVLRDDKGTPVWNWHH